MNDEYDDATGDPAQDPTAEPAGDPTGDPTGRGQADDAWVARVLGAAAAPVERLPEDVAARLDDALAGLTAARRSLTEPAPEPSHEPGPEPSPEPSAEAAVAPVDELAARRRRRRLGAGLLAAAVVSVAALGVGNLLDRPGTGSMESAGGDAGTAVTDRQVAPGASEEGLLRLHSGTLGTDLRRLGDVTLMPPASLADACVRPRLDPGDEWLRVLLDDRPAVLVLRAPEGGRRTAEVFTCDDGETPAARTRIPAG